MYRQSISDRCAMKKAPRFVRHNIVSFMMERVPSPFFIMAKSKAVFDKRVSLPCHVNRSGNMNDASANNANGRKIEQFHKGDAVA